MTIDKRIVAALACAALAAGASARAATGSASPFQGQTISRAAAQSSELTGYGAARRESGEQSPALKANIDSRKPKNVILLIGDGMAENEITIARNYEKGAGGFLDGIDAFPVTGYWTHYSLHKDGKINYVTDSAASATAWATGYKTYNGALGVDLQGKPVKTLLELAKAKGMGAGDVSTAEIQDATPAALFSHVTHRKCYGPKATAEKCPKETLEAGGLGSITEQLLEMRPDVTLGGGAKTFDETAPAGKWAGKTLKEQAIERGFQIVTDADQLKAVSVADQKKPLLGLFAQGNMPVRWLGPRAAKKGWEKDAPVIRCAPNPKRAANQPNLAAMTSKAIELLKGNPKGFFLQVEGASIDKQDHAANPCGQIGETIDLDEAAKVALDFARKDGDTVVVISADHAHTSQIIPEDTTSPGYAQKLLTKDNSIMYVNYATYEGEKDEMTHTGPLLRIAAYGPWAANFSGLIDQVDFHFIVKDALGL